MPSTPRAGLPSFWCTAIAKALAGEQPCLLAPFLAGHYDLEKRKRDDQSSLAVWKANHTALLEQILGEYRADGWKCDKERFFKVTGQTAILSGKVDLIAQKPDQRPLIVDAKSGKPRDSDVTQVLIEMVMIPLAWQAPQMQFAGKVVYTDHEIDLTPVDAEALKPRLFDMLKRLGMMGQRPVASPSESACRFCDVSDLDCPDRWKTDDMPAMTVEF